MSKKLKKIDLNQGQKIKVKTETIEVEKFNHPIFCFKFIDKDYHLDQCTPVEKQNLLEKIVMISGMTWDDVRLTGKHKLGSEKINFNSIKTKVPRFVTEEVNHLLAFHFLDKRAFVGYRNRFIFHILYIDRDFTLYKHS